nr:hypothetical protein [Tanacetum cinerariifolium]
MKANKEDLCHANVFIKTRTMKNGTIPDEDSRIVVDRTKEKLNETFGGGVSTRNAFGSRSSLRNTPSSDAIESMVQVQVDAQLETKVAKRVADLVVEQDAQIEAKVAAHVSNYEKAQMEWFYKQKLLLGRELPPPSGQGL